MKKINILKILQYSKKDSIFIFLTAIFLGIRRKLLSFKIYSKPSKLKILIIIIFGIQIGILLTRHILKQKINQIFQENEALKMFNTKLNSKDKYNSSSIEKLIETLTLTLTLTLALKKYITTKMNNVNNVLQIKNYELNRAYERAFSWEKVAEDAWDETTKYNPLGKMGQMPDLTENVFSQSLLDIFYTRNEFFVGDRNKDNKLDYEEYQELRLDIMRQEQENIDAIPASNK